MGVERLEESAPISFVGTGADFECGDGKWPGARRASTGNAHRRGKESSDNHRRNRNRPTPRSHSSDFPSARRSSGAAGSASICAGAVRNSRLISRSGCGPGIPLTVPSKNLDGYAKFVVFKLLYAYHQACKRVIQGAAGMIIARYIHVYARRVVIG